MHSKTVKSAETVIEVPFHDVDVAHVVWHGHYVKYFEIARCKLLDMIDYNYPQMKQSGYFWPVVDMRIKYIKPARFQQDLLVKATLTEWEYRLRVDYLITSSDGERLTKGYTTQVAVDMNNGEMLLTSPTVLYEKLGIEEPQ